MHSPGPSCLCEIDRLAVVVVVAEGRAVGGKISERALLRCTAIRC